MEILRTKAELFEWRKSQTARAPLGFVPTMGALHAGHLSLVQLSRSQCRSTVASIFVNPTQFGPSEDLARYPRPFEQDCHALQDADVDALFAPDASEIYSTDSSTFVEESQVSQPLCGKFRPGHFRGVATVVLKLFNLVRPNVAFFGQKDAQQCLVIERMVHDLDLPVRIVRGTTVRESDGLAMSSRNAYLNPDERKHAPKIYASLKEAEKTFKSGERNVEKIRSAARKLLGAPFEVQYWDIRHPVTLNEIETIGPEGALAAVAAYLGKTRLIDNLELR